jgi:hypothetical protein
MCAIIYKEYVLALLLCWNIWTSISPTSTHQPKTHATHTHTYYPFTVVYFDSATAGEIKRDVYNILVKQSYIYSTSVSPVFVRWSGICVCTCVRAHALICMCIYIYICVSSWEFVIHYPMKIIDHACKWDDWFHNKSFTS